MLDLVAVVELLTPRVGLWKSECVIIARTKVRRIRRMGWFLRHWRSRTLDSDGNFCSLNNRPIEGSYGKMAFFAFIPPKNKNRIGIVGSPLIKVHNRAMGINKGSLCLFKNLEIFLPVKRLFESAAACSLKLPIQRSQSRPYMVIKPKKRRKKFASSAKTIWRHRLWKNDSLRHSFDDVSRAWRHVDRRRR